MLFNFASFTHVRLIDFCQIFLYLARQALGENLMLLSTHLFDWSTVVNALRPAKYERKRASNVRKKNIFDLRLCS